MLRISVFSLVRNSSFLVAKLPSHQSVVKYPEIPVENVSCGKGSITQNKDTGSTLRTQTVTCKRSCFRYIHNNGNINIV